MLKPSRKGFRFGIPLGDNIIWAIGMIAYQWSSLENDIDLWIGATGTVSPSRQAGQRASFKERARLLRQLAEERAVEPGRSQLTSIIDRATGMQIERDEVIHRRWGAPSDSQLDDLRLFEQHRARRSDERRIDYQRLRDTALKIDTLRADLAQLIFTYGKRDDAEGFLLSVAWQRISGTPSQSP